MKKSSCFFSSLTAVMLLAAGACVTVPDPSAAPIEKRMDGLCLSGMEIWLEKKYGRWYIITGPSSRMSGWDKQKTF